MKISTELILKILFVLSCILFIGLGIQAGGFITNAVFALVNPAAVKYLYHEVDLTALLKYDAGHFFVLTLSMSIVAVMKAVLFYLIINILYPKKPNMLQLFSKEVGRFIFNISYLSLFIGLFSRCGVNYTGWLEKQGVQIPDIHHLILGGADVWLFMSVTLFVIALIFKRGIEIQSENDLTI